MKRDKEKDRCKCGALGKHWWCSKHETKKVKAQQEAERLKRERGVQKVV